MSGPLQALPRAAQYLGSTQDRPTDSAPGHERTDHRLGGQPRFAGSVRPIAGRERAIAGRTQPQSLSKVGYQDVTVTRIIRSRTEDLSFTLQSLATLDLSGEYVVTFEAASTCGNLPDAARSRTYDATIAGRASSTNNGFMEVHVHGASFFERRERGDTFFMHVADDFVRFYLDAEFGPGYVSENLGGSTYLTLTGAGGGPLTAGFRTAILLFDGDFDVCDVPPGANQAPCYYFKDPNKPRAVCHSADHRLTLTRRE